MNEKILTLIKRLPIDLGQGHYRHTTMAKITAFRAIGQGNGKRALDLGCGDGYWTKKLKLKGWDVTSADNFDFRNPTTVEVNCEEPLPFEDNQFDLLWSSEVIEHIEHVEKLVQEMRRIVKPGGKLVVTTPNSNFWLYRILRIFKITPKDIQNPDHKQFFTLKQIKELFPDAEILGFFPYALLKFVIRDAVGFLSPSFIIIEKIN